MTRLLILEDNDMIRRALLRRKWPVEVVVAATLEAAQQAVLHEDIGFVLSDVMLDPGFGTDLHDWLVGRKPELAANMVFMTGGVYDKGVKARLAALPNAVVHKPFNFPRIIEALGLSQRVREQ